MSVEIVTLIKTSLTKRGKGVEGDPIRRVTEYWTLDGGLEFEIDHWEEQSKPTP